MWYIYIFIIKIKIINIIINIVINIIIINIITISIIISSIIISIIIFIIITILLYIYISEAKYIGYRIDNFGLKKHLPESEKKKLLRLYNLPKSEKKLYLEYENTILKNL